MKLSINENLVLSTIYFTFTFFCNMILVIIFNCAANWLPFTKKVKTKKWRYHHRQLSDIETEFSSKYKRYKQNLSNYYYLRTHESVKYNAIYPSQSINTPFDPTLHATIKKKKEKKNRCRSRVYIYFRTFSHRRVTNV